MVQRGKVLEIEGPTPKFLYAMLKQLDLKIVDWNRVAAEQAISNGHAARMRFSRFRNQMEGTTGAQRPGRKRNSKKTGNAEKGGKGDSKALVFEMQQSANPAPGPSMETSGSFQYINAVKSEEGNQRISFPDMGELYPWSQGVPTSDTNYIPQMNHFMSPEIQHGMTYPGMPSSFPSGFPSMPSNPPWFYPSFEMMQDSTMQELTNSLPNFNYNQVANWEPTALNQAGNPPVKIEDDVELVEVKTESNISIKLGMPQDVAMQELTTSLPNFDYAPVPSCESNAMSQSETGSSGRVIEEDVQTVQAKTEPDIPIKVEPYQIE
ncbi:uncharacterized protein N7484_006506 [Penicillium longicatenatum]|uniref:uncharacterized protein n=1 Tax=Penicillium longicatenatum TaxID=1561947 RepID=UPI0025486B8C|nr:uncharacterized protein N7484_006506 [Penicillium longicatenatum]KAJ5643999.1 hypothetical protein N7484_006506 [Penicillium longicatenatum]